MTLNLKNIRSFTTYRSLANIPSDLLYSSYSERFCRYFFIAFDCTATWMNSKHLLLYLLENAILSIPKILSNTIENVTIHTNNIQLLITNLCKLGNYVYFACNKLFAARIHESVLFKKK